jgi:hypothetical protein
MILIVAALVGGLATLSIVSVFDLLAAFIAAPIGGSVFTGCVAVYLGCRRTKFCWVKTSVVPAVGP